MTNSSHFNLSRPLIAFGSAMFRFRPMDHTTVTPCVTRQSVSSATLGVSCPLRCTTDRPRSEKLGFRVFYLLIIHNERTMNDAPYLLVLFRDPRNIILIHVDKKAEHLLRNETNDDSSSPNSLYRLSPALAVPCESNRTTM
jgi:hypothetical protein